MAQTTQADRSAAAKKAAATRERNQQRKRSATAGRKAASTTQARAAGKAADQARTEAKGAFGALTSGVRSAARLTGTATLFAAKAVATRAGVIEEQHSKQRSK